MRKLTFLSFVCLIAFFSCKKEAKFSGVACGNVENSEELFTNDDITFTNCSKNATHYLWEFGDGFVSTSETPTHQYTEPGTYAVTLVVQDSELTDINGDNVVNSDDRLIGSSDEISFNIIINEQDIFPIVLSEHSITNTDVLFYTNGTEANLGDYDLEEVWQNPYWSYDAFWNYDSIKFENELNLTIYYNTGNTLQAEYEFRNDSLIFNRIYYEDAWTPIGKILTITGNYEQLTFAKTAFKYSGYSYKSDGTITDINMDGVIDEDDKIVNAEISEDHHSLDDINEMWTGVNFDHTKADTILVLQYNVMYEEAVK